MEKTPNTLPCVSYTVSKRNHEELSKAPGILSSTFYGAQESHAPMIEQLYTLALSTHMTIPALSRHYVSQLIQFIVSKNIILPPSITTTFCPRCFSIYIPGVNCTISSYRDKMSSSLFPFNEKKYREKMLNSSATLQSHSSTNAPIAAATPTPAPVLNTIVNPFANHLKSKPNKKQKKTENSTSFLDQITTLPSLLQPVTKNEVTEHNNKLQQEIQSLVRARDSQLKVLKLNKISCICLICNHNAIINDGVSAHEFRQYTSHWRDQQQDRLQNKNTTTVTQSEQKGPKTQKSIRRLKRGGARQKKLVVFCPQLEPLPQKGEEPINTIQPKEITPMNIIQSNENIHKEKHREKDQPINKQANKQQRNIYAENMSRAGLSLSSPFSTNPFAKSTSQPVVNNPFQSNYLMPSTTPRTASKKNPKNNLLSKLKDAKKSSGSSEFGL